MPSGVATNVLAGVEKCAPLSHNNVSRDHVLVCGGSNGHLVHEKSAYLKTF